MALSAKFDFAKIKIFLHFSAMTSIKLAGRQESPRRPTTSFSFRDAVTKTIVGVFGNFSMFVLEFKFIKFYIVPFFISSRADDTQTFRQKGVNLSPLLNSFEKKFQKKLCLNWRAFPKCLSFRELMKCPNISTTYIFLDCEKSLRRQANRDRPNRDDLPTIHLYAHFG